MPDVLHTDDPERTVTMPDGRVVRNLTADEYAATYADGDACNAGPERQAAVQAALEQLGGHE